MDRTTPPERRIVSSTPPARQPGRQGMFALSTLECGHVVETRAGVRRYGKCFCRACLAAEANAE